MFTAKLLAIGQPKQGDYILKKVAKYEKMMNMSELTTNVDDIFLTKQVLQDVVLGKTVLLVNSFNRPMMQLLYADFKLELANERYAMNFLAYSLSKDIKFCYKISKM